MGGARHITYRVVVCKMSYDVSETLSFYVGAYMNLLKEFIMNNLDKKSLSRKVFFIFIDSSLDMIGLYFYKLSFLLF